MSGLSADQAGAANVAHPPAAAAETGSMLLAVRGLRAGYGRGDQVIGGLTLELHAGRSLAVMGRNGMGKTTLMRAIMGLVAVSGGTIELAGQPISGWP